MGGQYILSGADLNQNRNMTNWLWGLVNTLTAEDEYTRFQAWILPWVEKCYFLPLSCQFYGQSLCAIDSGMNFESNETRKTPLVTFGLRPNVTQMFRNSRFFSLIFGAFQICLRSERVNEDPHGKNIFLKMIWVVSISYQEQIWTKIETWQIDYGVSLTRWLRRTSILVFKREFYHG